MRQTTQRLLAEMSNRNRPLVLAGSILSVRTDGERVQLADSSFGIPSHELAPVAAHSDMHTAARTREHINIVESMVSEAEQRACCRDMVLRWLVNSSTCEWQ